VTPNALPLLDRLAGRQVLVVGDVMLDEYLWGSAWRISPEAPVPVVDLDRHNFVPGGAANAAANAAGLGAAVALVGVVGEDGAAERLRSALTAHRVRAEGLVAVPGRPTTAKTRIIAHGQHIVRVDHEERGPLPAEPEARLVGLATAGAASADACVLSDYAKGVVSARLAQALIAAAGRRGCPVVVDPKGNDFAKYQGATLVKPNLHEAGLFLRREVVTDEDVVAAGQRLREALGGGALLLTRGAAGMTLFLPGQGPLHIPSAAQEVYDVTGAGDTVTATLAVALAAGASLEEAARLANRAAAITVGRVGTAAVRIEELRG
jgi:D-beta-D-heptose 7-phosphate kinase/D-beta-D-heptose 1-phosphate adenosyltransferase